MGMSPPPRVPVVVSIVALVIVVATISHIGNLSERIEQLEQDREAQALDIALLDSAVDNLTTASETLQSEVGRFDYENWRDVVGDVRSAAVDIQLGLEQVRSTLAYLQ